MGKLRKSKRLTKTMEVPCPIAGGQEKPRLVGPGLNEFVSRWCYAAMASIDNEFGELGWVTWAFRLFVVHAPNMALFVEICEFCRPTFQTDPLPSR